MPSKRRPPESFPRAKHGSPSTYANGCGCDACRVAWRVYRLPRNRAYAARKRAERETGEQP